MTDPQKSKFESCPNTQDARTGQCFNPRCACKRPGSVSPPHVHDPSSDGSCWCGADALAIVTAERDAMRAVVEAAENVADAFAGHDQGKLWLACDHLYEAVRAMQEAGA